MKHLQRHEQGRTFEIIYRTSTEELGYTVYYKVIGAQKVVPQHRERIFLVDFEPWRIIEFPDFPKDGPKLETMVGSAVRQGRQSSST